MIKKLIEIVEDMVFDGELEDHNITFMDALRTKGSEVVVKSKDSQCPYARKGVYGQVITPITDSTDEVEVEYETPEGVRVACFCILDVVPVELEEVYLKHLDDYEQRGKDIKKSYTQKNNWRKYRGNYMRGIRKAAKEKERSPDIENKYSNYKYLDKIMKKQKENESMRMITKLNNLLIESGYTTIDLENSDKFDLEDLESSGETTEEVSLDELNITADMLKTEVYLYDNLITDFDVDYIHSEKVEDEEGKIETYYFDIVLENHKVATLMIHKKEDTPEMIIITDNKLIKTITLSKSFIKEDELSLMNPEALPIKTIKEAIYSLSKYPKEYGYRLEGDTKRFFKKEKRNFKNLSNEQKKALVDSKYFNPEEQNESFELITEEKKFFDALKDYSDQIDKKEKNQELLQFCKILKSRLSFD